jgi:hypothetical protein
MIKLASEDFIPVTGDDWYQRRREDAEGDFFRKIADQGPRKGADGSTRQGIYCFTASGKLLAYKNAQDADVMREVVEKALAAWKRMPADERAPGTVKVADAGKPDKRYHRAPPTEGLVLNVHARILDRDDKGDCHKGSCDSAGGDLSARDHLWLTKPDWQSLMPKNVKTGDRFPMPASIAQRIARFHMVDDTRGEPRFWSSEQVRRAEVLWTVEDATPTDADIKKADRGFDVRLLGYFEYDPMTKEVSRFDIVAIGDHWGETELTRGARKGRQPLGVAFELSKGGKPVDKVPPQAARDYGDYLGK